MTAPSATSMAPPTVWCWAIIRFLKMLSATRSWAVSASSGRAAISEFRRKPAEALSGAFRQGQLQVLPLRKTDKARRGLLWADVNGDGRPDLLVAEPESGQISVYLQKPDGTLALIPAWMSEETARSTAITSSPCLSVDRLVELRVRLDALLASPDGESAPHEGGDHATTTEPAARPVRSRSKDVGHSDHAEASACQPDRAHAGRGPSRRRRRDTRGQRQGKGGR